MLILFYRDRAFTEEIGRQRIAISRRYGLLFNYFCIDDRGSIELSNNGAIAF